MNTNSPLQTTCKICIHTNWKIIDTLISGIWDRSNVELVRKILYFPIAQCQHCYHVQVTVPYTDEIFNSLYFSSNLEPDMWCDTPIDNKSPYEEMVDFIAPYITENIHVVDFGAGAGTTLKYIAQEYPSYSLKFSSVDFHDHTHSNTITHIDADLNKLDNIKKYFNKKSISLAISTHVLEHIIEPIYFLQNIGSILADDGYIFIEVPDCSQDAFIENLAVTNLVHGQHIHYYSKDSIALLIKKSGFKIVKQQQLTTGNIPRLMLLLEKDKTTEFIMDPKITNTAKHAVEKRFSAYKKYQNALFDIVKLNLKKNKKIGFWGLGGDFYLFTKNYPSIIESIKQQHITLYDYDLAGHTFEGQRILSSSELEHASEAIYIIPIYAPTKEKMKKISKMWSISIADI
ncbi:hypothetical protein C9I43_10000 [Shewanella morhuae]|uniref:Uncharacterized protein n=1 Tax=Shewanella morhuae TaxID=365591 RepID=A0ABX5HVA9_9GAMM|nr:class I SAM-dependent methyltransferase [Shewanella morhuae]PTA50816.1 hypothetical protein C9I43_10000 [Shewanella morhuae]